MMLVKSLEWSTIRRIKPLRSYWYSSPTCHLRDITRRRQCAWELKRDNRNGANGAMEVQYQWQWVNKNTRRRTYLHVSQWLYDLMWQHIWPHNIVRMTWLLLNQKKLGNNRMLKTNRIQTCKVFFPTIYRGKCFSFRMLHIEDKPCTYSEEWGKYADVTDL